MGRFRLLAVPLVLGLIGVACGGDPSEPPTPSPGSTTFNAQMATVDLYTGAPQRAQIGMVALDPDKGVRLVTYGSVEVAFSYLGADGSGQPEPGPSASARYIPAYGTDDSGTEPALTPPAKARGVYQADVEFDRAGLWRAEVSFSLEGSGALSLSTTFPVVDDPTYPAPGDRAPLTRNLTLDDEGDVPASAIDSLALDGAPIPDPELHDTTVAAAIADGRPIVLVVGTPAFCQSQWCGPQTQAVADLAARNGGRAAFIHIELWKEYAPPETLVINQGAAEWVFRNGDATDPWLFLIGADGRIVDRWMPLFEPAEVEAALEALPAAGH